MKNSCLKYKFKTACVSKVKKVKKLGEVKFLTHSAHWADSKVHALFKIHQFSDIHLNACFFYM